jgi:type II secretory pathway pseudopilin PulG
MMHRWTRRNRDTGGRRLPVLQLLVVVCIVATVGAIGLPAYAARAKGEVLRQNAHTLQGQVREAIALTDGAVEAGALCAAIADAAERHVARPYTNPLNGSREVVLGGSARGGADAPALWIVDDAKGATAAAGTLIVLARTQAGQVTAVEVRYVDGSGTQHCAGVLTLL